MKLHFQVAVDSSSAIFMNPTFVNNMCWAVHYNPQFKIATFEWLWTG